MRMSLLSDARLVRQTLAGRREAFDVLVERHHHVVRSVAWAHMGNRGEAEDAMQEAFVKAFESLHTLRKAERIAPWLATIARRTCYGLMRTAQRRAEVESEAAPPDSAPPVDLEGREVAELVRRQLDGLAPDQREILLLRYYAGKRVREVAAILTITPDAAAKRLQRAREALGQRLLEALRQTQQQEQDNTAKCVSRICGAVALVHAPWESSAAAAATATPLLWLTFGKLAVVVVLAAIGAWTVKAVYTRKGNQAGPAQPPSAARPSDDAPTVALEGRSDGQGRAGLEAAWPVGPAGESSADAPSAGASEPSPSRDAGISGRVYDKDTGKGITQAEVRAFCNECEPKGANAVLDADGHYRFEGLPPGEYQVKVRSVEGYPWTRNEVPPLQVLVQAGIVAEDIDFAFSKGLSVSGRVLDPTGNPLAEASVSGSTRNNWHSYDVLSDEAGEFTLIGFPETDRLYIQPTKEGYALAPQGPFEVPPGGLEGVTLRMQPEAVMRGWIVDGQGEPLAGVRVSPGPDRSPWSMLSGFRTEPSDGQGRFEVVGLFPGTYHFSMVLPGERRYRRLEDGPLVEVGVGETVEDVLLVYAAEPRFTISGRVTDAAGKPIAGAVVKTSEMFGTDIPGARTDVEGRYVLHVEKTGEHDMWVTHRDYTPAQRRWVQAGSEGVDFQLDGLGAVAGQVVDARTGDAVTEFSIGARSREELTRINDPEGRFRFSRLQKGARGALVEAAGYVSQYVKYRIRPSQTTDGIVVRLEPGAVVEGVVLSPDGQPVNGAKLFLEEFPESGWGLLLGVAAESATDGTFRLDSAPSESTTVYAYHHKYAPASAAIRWDGHGVGHATVRCREGGTLRGCVRADGAPLPGVRVMIGLEDAPVYEDETGTDGSYRIQGLPTGEMSVKIETSFGRRPMWFGRTLVTSAHISSGKATDLDFDLDLWDTEVAGCVTVNGQPPADDATVVFLDYEGAAGDVDTFHTWLDDEGRFTFDGTPPGPARLTLKGSRFARRGPADAEEPSMAGELEFPSQEVEVIEGQPNFFEFNVEFTE